MINVVKTMKGLQENDSKKILLPQDVLPVLEDLKNKMNSNGGNYLGNGMDTKSVFHDYANHEGVGRDEVVGDQPLLEGSGQL